VAANPGAPDPKFGPIEQSYALYRAELSAFFTRYTRSVSAAEDLVHEVYERLLRYPPREPVRDPQKYLFQTAHNVLRSAHRRARIQQQRYLHCEPQELQLFAEGLSRLWVEEEGGDEVAQQEFVKILNQLPRAYRVALLRQRRDGWNYQQISAELGVSVNTVKDYIVKTLNHFRLHYCMDLKDR